MIYYEPLPLFDAVAFLTRRATSRSIGNDIERLLKKYPYDFSDSYYLFEPLLQIEQRLNDAVTIDDESLNLIAGTLYSDNMTLFYKSNICELLMNAGNALAIRDEEGFFDAILRRVPMLSADIAAIALDNPSITDKPLTNEALFDILRKSELPRASRFTLMDLAINTNDYIQLMRKAVVPVAIEFENCRELWEPLLAQYRLAYQEYSSCAAVMEERYGVFIDGFDSCNIYPSIVGFGHYLFSFVEESRLVNGFVGALEDVISKVMTLEHDPVPQLLRFASTLADISRFNILRLIAERPYYGREIANEIGISPVTVSQHLTSLSGIGLVSSSVDGRRAYHSLDKQKMEYYLNGLKAIFIDS